MSWVVTEIPSKPHRLLVLSADTAVELDALIEKASRKGWSRYVEGTVPDTTQLGAWMLKSAEDSQGM